MGFLLVIVEFTLFSGGNILFLASPDYVRIFKGKREQLNTRVIQKRTEYKRIGIYLSYIWSF